MVQYLCDFCKKVIDKPDEIFIMPRRVAYYATCCGTKLNRIEKIKPMNTILCNECCGRIANMLIADDWGNES